MLIYGWWPLMLNGQPTSNPEATLQQIRVLDNEGQRMKAMRMLDDFLLQQEEQADSFYAEGLWLYGRLLQKEGKYRQAIDTFQHLRDWSHAHLDTLFLIDAHDNLAYCCFRIGNLDTARIHAEKAVDLARAAGEDRRIRHSLITLGTVFFEQHRYLSAMDYFVQALELAERDQDQADMAKAYHEIALVYKVQKQWSRADSVYQLSMQLAQKSGDPWTRLGILNDWGIVLKELGRYPEAEQKYQEALLLTDSLSYPPGKSIVRCNLGILQYEMANYERAFQLLTQAKQAGITYQMNGLQAESLIYLARTLLALNQPSAALGKGLEAADILEEDGDMKKTRNLQETLYMIYKAQGQYQQALQAYERYTAIRDSLGNQKTNYQITELETRYQSERQKRALLEKNNRIALLEQENRLARKQQTLVFGGSLILLLSLGLIFRSWNQNRIAERARLQKEAEQWAQLHHQKSRFLANLAHELRTPLTLISGPVDHFLERYGGQLTKQQQKWLQKASRNTHRLNVLVEEVLDLSRLEDQKLGVSEEPVALLSFVRRVFNQFESNAQLKVLHYNLQLPDQDPGWVLLDTAKVEKVLNNLLSNAIKFTDRGGRVALSLQAESDKLVFRVMDSGRGIDEADLPHIFDRYYQTRRSDLPLEGGSGIGLALARELTELLGGSLQVDSTFGKGSTFTFSLPLKVTNRSNGKPVSTANGSTALSVGPNPSPNAPVLLVVEDNPDMQDYLRAILEEDYRILSATNGEEALQVLDQQRPELILSDVMMPGMDGFTLLNQLKNKDHLADIPVVMLTARTDQRDKLTALHIGVDDYLTKPFSQQELQVRLQNILGFQRERKQQSEAASGTPLLSQADRQWLKKVENHLRAQIDNPAYTVRELAKTVNLSERQLSRRLKQLTGMPPSRYFREMRLQQARVILEKGTEQTVAEVSYAVGFDTPDYFSRLYLERFGKRPSDYL